jgi:DNA-binding CsgD family transcriptional regulator
MSEHPEAEELQTEQIFTPEQVKHQHYMEGMEKRRQNTDYHKKLSESRSETWAKEPARTNMLAGLRGRGKQKLQQTWTPDKRKDHGQKLEQKSKAARLKRIGAELPEEREVLVALANQALTARELEILRMLYNEKTPREIADHFGYRSSKTVHTLTYRIHKKLEKARAELHEPKPIP